MKNRMVFELVGKNAISLQSGTKLYNEISKDVINGKEVQLDFSKVDLFASPFFNASIGLLLRDISLDELMKRVHIVNLNSVGKKLLNHVINNALSFYSDEDKVTSAINKALPDAENNSND
jgi:hypothetical protein